MIDTNNQQFDAIVVGTGPGGATVAKELSRKNKKVLILEWGKNVKIKASKLAMLFMAGIPGKGVFLSSGLPVVRGITTGGSTIFYYATAFEPAYETLEKYGVDIMSEVAEAKEELPFAPLADDLVGPMAQRIMASALDLGYDWQKFPKFIYQDKCRSECWKCAYGCPHGAKWNTRMYVEDAVAHGAVLTTRARVERVILENGQATGVEYVFKGKTKKAFADKVILSAGGIGTPVILRASGIKDAGYDFFIDPLVTVMGQVKDLKGGTEVPMVAGARMEGEGYLLTDMIMPKAMFRFFTGMIGKYGKMFAHGRALQIMVKVKDGLGGMLNDDGAVRKYMSVSDLEKLDKGTAHAKKILSNAGATDIYTAIQMAGHPGGTVKIGDLVDADLKSRFDNLYVCDCSVIPEEWGLPPTLTLVGLGKRLAKYLVE